MKKSLLCINTLMEELDVKRKDNEKATMTRDNVNPEPNVKHCINCVVGNNYLLNN